jgi:hypothetical protein
MLTDDCTELIIAYVDSTMQRCVRALCSNRCWSASFAECCEANSSMMRELQLTCKLIEIAMTKHIETYMTPAEKGYSLTEIRAQVIYTTRQDYVQSSKSNKNVISVITAMESKRKASRPDALGPYFGPITEKTFVNAIALELCEQVRPRKELQNLYARQADNQKHAREARDWLKKRKAQELTKLDCEP